MPTQTYNFCYQTLPSLSGHNFWITINLYYCFYCISALPANKFVCGNELCDKYVEYCDDPSGNGDIDFTTCKQCSYSIDQCIAGDYHPGCTKYCYGNKI